MGTVKIQPNSPQLAYLCTSLSENLAAKDLVVTIDQPHDDEVLMRSRLACGHSMYSPLLRFMRRSNSSSGNGGQSEFLQS